MSNEEVLKQINDFIDLCWSGYSVQPEFIDMPYSTAQEMGIDVSSFEVGSVIRISSKGLSQLGVENL